MTITHLPLRFAVALSATWASAHDAAASRVQDIAGDDRGEVTSTTIVIAALAALALAVMAIIVGLVQSKASQIQV